MAANQPIMNPTGFEPEVQDITRQRELSKFLLQQGLQGNLQGQMVSGRYVPSHPLEGIANIYSAYKGRQLGKEADKKQAELAKLLRQETMADMGSYMEAIQGKPETPDVIPQGQTLRDDQGQITMGSQAGTPAVGPNYNKALAVALGSRSPLVQALGTQAITEMNKPQKLAEGEQFVRFNPQSNKYDTIGGGGPKLTNDIRNYQFDVSQGYKGTFNQWSIDQKKASAQNINVQNAVPFQEQLYTDAAKALVTDYNTLKSIPSQVKQLDRVAQLAPKSFAGSFADTKTQVAKFFNNNLGTNIAADKVSNTEELRAVLFTNIMDNLKKMDASPSQEQQRLMQASLGSIGTDPNALPAVVNVYKQVLLDKAEEHNKRVGQTVEKGFKYPYDITVNVPKAAPAAPAGNKTTPNVGDIQNGWQYMGGNPAVPTSWKRAQ
jgi:hypothetical protein